ncbi:MAG: hypothetical protein ACOX4J_05845 [Anaerovoracaceae bacterium]|jgi:hypothetical protein
MENLEMEGVFNPATYYAVANQNSNQYPYEAQNEFQNADKYITYGQMNLINDFRTLWRDLVIWLRSYQVSSVTGFSNVDAINKRLYRIPEIFKEKLEPFFGVDHSERFAQLLHMYIVKFQILVSAQIAADQQAANAAAVDLYRFVEEVADCLARSNPYWSKDQWQYLLNHLTGMAIRQIIALLAEEYDTELDIRDRMLKHALVLGDYMAQGVMHYLVP